MTATTRTAEIPAELKPADGRFGCGPSKVRPEALARLAERADLMGTSHRQAPVRDLVGSVRDGLADLFGLPDGYEVVLGNGGTTAFWDTAVAWLVRERALHLIYGEFSQKFAKETATAPVPRGADPGRSRPRRRSRAGRRPRRRRDRLGAQRDLDRSDGRRAPRPRTRASRLVLIDGTSGAGGLPLDPAEADAYYFAPQKAFGADGGLWLALLSPAAIASAEDLDGAAGRWQPAFLSLPTAIENSRKNQTYNTPALATLLLLADQIEWMLAGGGPRVVRRPLDRIVAGPLRMGGGGRFRDPVRRRPGQALARRRDDRLRRGRRRRGAGLARCGPTGSSMSSPTASSAAISSGSGCSRPSTPPTSRLSPHASTG